MLVCQCKGLDVNASCHMMHQEVQPMQQATYCTVELQASSSRLLIQFRRFEHQHPLFILCEQPKMKKQHLPSFKMSLYSML